jgi:hypothetical protein
MEYYWIGVVLTFIGLVSFILYKTRMLTIAELITSFMGAIIWLPLTIIFMVLALIANFDEPIIKLKRK